MQRKVTGIEQQKRNPNRVNIYLDEQFAFGLHKYVACNLKMGDLLDEQSVQRLIQEDTVEEAYQKALRLLGYRPRTEYEMRSRLAEYGYEEDCIENVIARLLEKKYLDDRQFAEDWVENRSTFRPRGRRLLTMELRQKQVSENQIRTALETIPEDAILVRQAAEKYCTKLKGLDKQSFKRKLYGFLARKGFNYDDIKPILEEMWEENSSLNLVETEVTENE
jgi:regulatory protein